MAIENEKNRYNRWWKRTRISNLAILSLYSILGRCWKGTRISNLARTSLYSISGPVTSIMVRLPYIRSYGASTPISDFTGRGHFVTYIRYFGTKWPCKLEVRYVNLKMNIFDIFAAASFEYAVYSNLAATDLHSGLASGRASWGRVCWLEMTWREQEFSGILRNPEESWVNTGITAHRNSCRKNPVKSKKKRNSCDLSKTTFLWKNPPENAGKKRNPEESCQERFFGPKK